MARVAAQAARQFVARHVGQPDVEDEHFGGGVGARQRVGRVLVHVHRVAMRAQQHGQRMAGVAVVVDDGDRQRMRLARALARAHGLAHLGLRERQRDRHRRALLQAGAVRRHLPVVHAHDALHEREADPEAALRAVRRAVGLREQVEHVRQQLRVDAAAVVAHLRPRLAAVDRDREHDAPARRRVLGRVVEQVDEHLDQPRAVALDRHRRVRQLHRQCVLALLDVRARLFHGRHRDLVQVEDLVLQFDQAARDARDVQQVVDQLRHVAHLARDDVAGLQAQPLVHFGQAQELGRARDRRQRIAQFVRQHREELVLHLVVALGLGARGALAGQQLFAFLRRALGHVVQARIVDRDRGLHGEGADQFLAARVEHGRLRVAEEQAADHFARARDHRRRQVARDGQMARRHAVVRRHRAVARVLADVVAADRRAAAERGPEHLGGTRLAERRERLPRRARQRVQQIGLAVVVAAVVEERAEFRADELRGGVRDGLQQRFEIERRRQRLARALHQFEHAGFLAQRFLGAAAAQRFPRAPARVFQQAHRIRDAACVQRRGERQHGRQALAFHQRHRDAGVRAVLRAVA